MRLAPARTALDPALVGVQLKSGDNVVSADVFSALETWTRSGGMFLGNGRTIIAMEMDVAYSSAVHAAFVAEASESPWYVDRVTLTDGSRTATFVALALADEAYATYMPVDMTVAPPEIFVRSVLVGPAPVSQTTLPAKAPAVLESVAQSAPAADVHTQHSAAPDDDDKLPKWAIATIVFGILCVLGLALALYVVWKSNRFDSRGGYTLLF
jgi:hypothetical protein